MHLPLWGQTGFRKIFLFFNQSAFKAGLAQYIGSFPLITLRIFYATLVAIP